MTTTFSYDLLKVLHVLEYHLPRTALSYAWWYETKRNIDVIAEIAECSKQEAVHPIIGVGSISR